MTRGKSKRKKGLRKEGGYGGAGRPGSARVSGTPAIPTDPRKRPRQERARATVAAILAAAAETFAERGYAGTTTNRIARRAGVSIGSLYQYFPNKDALLAGLMEQHREQIHSVVEESTRDFEDQRIPIREALRSMLGSLVELHEADPELARAIDNTAFHLHHAVGEHRGEEHEYARWMEQVLRQRADVRQANARVMAHVVVRATEALTRWLVHEAPGDLDKATAVEEVVLLLDGYVREQPIREPGKEAAPGPAVGGRTGRRGRL
jgi:AcrR family transcriptional regulator